MSEKRTEQTGVACQMAKKIREFATQARIESVGDAHAMVPRILLTQWAAEIERLERELAEKLEHERRAAVETSAAQFTIHSVAVQDEPDACRIEFKVANQGFHIGPDYLENREHAKWFITQFKIALSRMHRVAETPETPD